MESVSVSVKGFSSGSGRVSPNQVGRLKTIEESPCDGRQASSKVGLWLTPKSSPQQGESPRGTPPKTSSPDERYAVHKSRRTPEEAGAAEKPQDPAEVEVFHSFDDMELPENLLRGIYGYGFEMPSHVQKQAIVPMSKGKDVLGQASAGAGKTAAFLIGMMAQMNTDNNITQGVILAPVRELAKQTYGVMMQLAQYMKGFKGHCCVGGTGVRQDIQALREGQHVVVGTPGRMLHMVTEKHLDLRGLRTIILDEADELLSRGFMDGIYEIFQYVPQNVQACLFSATIPPEIQGMANKILRDDKIVIRVRNQDLSRIGDIKQFYIDVEQPEWKMQTLLDLYSCLSVNQSIIFTNTKRACTQLYEDLERNDFTCTMIQGDMEQSERNAAIKAFKSGSSRVLLSSGLIKRGMDFQSVNLVINYDMPQNKHTYIHAVGRVGRYGRKGVAINFVAGRRDLDMMREIEEWYNTQVEEMPFPDEIMKYM